jgi:lipid-binding SYLF domain-containing protein
MRTLAIATLSLSLVATAGLSARAERIVDAANVLTEMAASFDSGIPKDLITKAECIVIVPGVKKGAIGFGGQYGRGYMSCRQNGGWSAPSGMRIEGGSVGFQIGGSSTDVILLVMNSRGVDKLLSSKFTVGADAAVAAGPLGRQASASTDATMRAEMLAWSRSRGVFAGVSLQGSTLRTDTDENKDLYGRELSAREIVRGTIKSPAAASPLMSVLAKY